MDLEKKDSLAFPDAEAFKNVVDDAIKLAQQLGATHAEAG